MSFELKSLDDLKKIFEILSLLDSKTEKEKAHPFLNKHCVIRTYSAGVHVGILHYANGTEAWLKDCQRIWKWEGAFTLSEVATLGIKKTSRLSKKIDDIYLTQVIEIIPATVEALKTFAGAQHE